MDSTLRTYDEALAVAKALQQLEQHKKYNKIEYLFPKKGPLRRELYKKHMEFFKAGAIHRERIYIGGNRTGKTEGGGGYETALHLTGRYPDSWQGRRFEHPVKWLVSGDTGQTTRDIIQNKMLGGLYGSDEWGSGLIQKKYLNTRPATKPGISGAYEEVKVDYVSGGQSTLMFRSYDQGRRIFQGIELDGFWADEEVPEDVYAEGLIRTMTTDGMVILTFTPLNGLTPLVQSLMAGVKEQEPLL